MKRSKKETKPEPIQVWNLAQARAARPYLESIIRSLREYSLEVIALRQKLGRLNGAPGRPDRKALIEIQDVQSELQRADTRMHEAAAELSAMDIYSLDPVQGTAQVPFVQDEQLAWYIFNGFDTDPFRYWRFQSDPDDTRRPVTSRQHGRAEATQWG